MSRNLPLHAIVVVSMVLAVACDASSGSTSSGDEGSSKSMRGNTADSTEVDSVAVTSDTRNVMGVECVVVEDTVTENGTMTEKTYDWYAQNDKGSVWYFGEDSGEYESGQLETKEGSWEAGKHGAKPGIIMPANPKVGHT